MKAVAAIRPFCIIAAFNTPRHIKKQTLKETHSHLFIQATEAKTLKQQTLMDTLKRKEKFPQDSNMARNITEKVIRARAGHRPVRSLL